MKQFYIIKEEQEKYKVFSLFDNFSPIYYDYMYNAIELCRMRLNKELQNDKLKIIHLPFTKIWIVL